MKLISPYIIIAFFLLAYQEYRIGEHQLAVLPEAAEEHIIGEVGKRAATKLLHAEEQPILQAILEPGAYEDCHLAVFLDHAHIPPAFLDELIYMIVLLQRI